MKREEVRTYAAPYKKSDGVALSVCKIKLCLVRGND